MNELNAHWKRRLLQAYCQDKITKEQFLKWCTRPNPGIPYAVNGKFSTPEEQEVAELLAKIARPGDAEIKPINFVVINKKTK